MLRAVVVVPSAPLLVPQLSGPLADEAVPVRTAVIGAAAALVDMATSWIAIGADDPGGTPPPGRPIHSGRPTAGVGHIGEKAPLWRGSFTGFGVDVQVEVGGRALADTDSGVDNAVVSDRSTIDVWMPLSILVAGWIGGQIGGVGITPVVVPSDASPDICFQWGKELRRRADENPADVGVLVVADGPASLTDRAPGGFDQRSPALQRRFERAFSHGDRDTLAGLDVDECAEAGFAGRAPIQVMAGLFGAAEHIDSHVCYSQAPWGVGYLVGSWTPSVEGHVIQDGDPTGVVLR